MTKLRLATPLLFTLLFLLLLGGLWRMDASSDRILNGIMKLGWLVALMWPPSAGGVLPELLVSLMESLAMAFLGTLLAALVALPLALLGAGNIVALSTADGRLYEASELLADISDLQKWITDAGCVSGIGAQAIIKSSYHHA